VAQFPEHRSARLRFHHRIKVIQVGLIRPRSYISKRICRFSAFLLACDNVKVRQLMPRISQDLSKGRFNGTDEISAVKSVQLPLKEL
jgi:hypothetical protein